MVEFTEENFKKEVLESSVPVVVDFWATWCGPCKAMTPVMEELSREFGVKAMIGKLNVDENPSVTEQHGVFNIPTLIFFKKGKEADRLVGINTKAKISKKIEELL
jgi:thioredoxin 1